jgi:hypothetical protein
MKHLTAILIVLIVTSLPTFGEQGTYYGRTDISCTGGATGHVYTEKVNGQWWLCDPEGYAYFMEGVYYVTGNSWTDELGSDWETRATAKYGAQKWPAQLLRLEAWGFNALGPGTYNGVLPMNQSVTKLPFVNGDGYVNPSINCVLSGTYNIKNIYKGIDTGVFGNQYSASFADVFDPAFTTCSNALFTYSAETSGQILYGIKDSPYLIGFMSEDTDFINGFGAGPDFPNDPPEKYGNHLGFMALVASPTQTDNPYNGNYADTEFYTKSELADFLETKYGTISALNAAWGSSYTTFGSDGGWGTGDGLLDENGTGSHLGTENLWMTQEDIDAECAADLDDFLYKIAYQYLSVTKASYNSAVPNKLFFGPTNIGGAGWRAPGRCPILEAAGDVLDVVNIGTDLSTEQLAWIEACTGDVPIAIWTGSAAQADSGRYRYTETSIWGNPPPTWSVETQEARGALHLADITKLVAWHQAVGFLLWQFLDNSGEQTDWGLVSLVDNAYDGVESVTGSVSCSSPLGAYTCGGEEYNWGDFISYVQEANAKWLTRGSTTPQGKARGKGKFRGKVKLQ